MSLPFETSHAKTILKIFVVVPAGTLRYIYVVFMFEGYVEITFDFMLECLVFLM